MDDPMMLCLDQPWASLVALHLKTIETRGWATKYRDRLVIAANASIPSYLGLGRKGRLQIGDIEIEKDGPGQMLLRGPKLSWPYRLPFGAVVAVCDLVDVVPIVDCPDTVAGSCIDATTAFLWRPCPDLCDHYLPTDITDQLPFGDFTPGRYAWLLDNVRAVDPIPCKGHQRLRRCPVPLPDVLS